MHDPVAFGRRLASHIIDTRADATPNRTYARIPYPNWRAEGFQDVTYCQIARAIDRVSWLMHEKLGPDGKKHHTSIAYAGPSDLRYCFVIVACMKTGRAVLLPDSLMTPQTRWKLLQRGDCTAFMRADGMELKAALPEDETRHLICVGMPSLEELIADGEVPRYDPGRSFAEVKDERVMMVHTSGTTGLPKIIPFTNGSIASFDALVGASEQGPSSQRMGMIYLKPHLFTLMTFPCPWLGGLYSVFFHPIFLEVVVMLPPVAWSYPYPPSDVVTLAEKAAAAAGGRLHATWQIPSLIREIAKDLSLLDRLCAVIDFIHFAGAPLDEWVGDAFLKRGILPVAGPGSTEMANLPVVTSAPEDWRYYHFHPANGIEFEETEEGSELYELVVKRKGHSTTQNVFHSFPELQEFRSSDVYTRHPDPTKPDLWLMVGRKDDFVKMSNMTPFRAGDIEVKISKHPCVHDVLVGGAGQPAPFLLVELEPSRSNGTELSHASSNDKTTNNAPPHKAASSLDNWAKGIPSSLSELIAQINASNPKSVQIRQELVIVVDPIKMPFQRTLKGTINRLKTVALYKDVVDEVYRRLKL